MTTPKLFSHSSPVFPVKDVIETANYYKEYLGFDITFTYGDPPYYSVVIREDIGIHFYKVEDSSISIQSNQLFIFVYDVDALYHEFQQKGVKDMQAPANREYGMRDFDLYDLNRHRITFGKSLEL